MAPNGGGKRKRGDRTYSYDSNESSRPSPHRPGNLSLGQQNYQQQSPQQYGSPQYGGFPRDQQEQRGRGRGRGGRGGRGGSMRSPLDGPNAIPVHSRQGSITSKTMSPPQAPPQQRSAEPIESPVVQPSNSITTTSTQTNPQVEAAPLVRYQYERVTDDICNNWQSTGRNRIIELGTQARLDEDFLVLGSVFQELIRSGLDGRIDSSDAGSAVRSILENEPLADEDDYTPAAFSGVQIFLDCLGVLTENDVSHTSLAPMVLATGISPVLMREELESSLLENLGLIRTTFVRMGIRRQTNLLYRQSNYNLLREETEGYSKLITELFTTSGNELPSAEVVEDTFERVKAMIGTFDLDVGRALDVTLDVFAALLVKHHRFFVKYLRVSSWWPQPGSLHGTVDTTSSFGSLPMWALPDASPYLNSNEAEKAKMNEARTKRDIILWDRVREIGTKAFFEIGGRKADPSSSQPPIANVSAEEMSSFDDDCKWIETTGTVPPSGNKTAAQVLGFKLRFYSSSTRESNDVLPVNLIDLAALLIKIGFISLRDLYPHLWPADEDMEKVKEEKMKEKLEREKLNRPGGGAMNALMAAGALADDTLPSSGRLREVESSHSLPAKLENSSDKTTAAAKSEVPEDLPEPSDQKVQLLKSLLCIGAIPESLYILGRFPWLPDAFPDLPEYIHRIAHISISKVYDPLRPLQNSTGLREQHKTVDLDQSGAPKGQVRQVDQPPRKILRWLQLDKDDEGTDYRFYWDEWSDNVPVCQTVDDVFALCGSFLNYSGVKIGQDPSLLVKLARIGIHSLATDLSESNKSRWIDLSKRLLVPALSLTKSNAGVVTEVFELIKQFPTKIRYSIYAEWFSGATSRLPDIKAAFDQVRAETRDVLKRISKTNVKSMARALAKVATASPGVVFSVAIGQIESYENLVDVVVECARYFTYLGYDVLTWSLMSSLGGRGRNHVQADGMLTSRWLAALALFAGKVFKRYSVMSPTPILQYVTEQLRKGNSTDLVVLEEITSSMGGIVSDTNFNEAQVLAMAGGDILQAQTMLQLLDRRHESTLTAKRLMKSLVEPKLAGQLLVSIAQERQTCIFKIPEHDAHLKLLGNLFDEIHRILTQYLDLLRSRLSVKDFDALVPNVSRLIGEFGIEPSAAFWIARPSIAAEIKEYNTQASDRIAERKQSPEQKGLDPSEKQDTEMAGIETDSTNLKLIESSNEDSTSAVNGEELSLDTIMKEDSQEDLLVQSLPSKVASSEPQWHPVLQSLMEELRSQIPRSTWEVLSAPFYVTFWQLSLGDLLVPTQSYEDEINRQKKKITSINSDRSDLSIFGSQKKDREKKLLTEVQDQLRIELKEQISSYQQTRSRLQKEKEFWFADCWGRWDALNIALLEHCFFPRILISPVDAMYTFKMLKLLHSTGAKNFRTMGLFDQLFNGKRLTSMFFLCTSKEADNIGRFLNETLKDLSRWHSDKALFEKEAYGPKKDLPGFSKKMIDEKTILAFWDYEDFRRVLQKWHMNVHNALKACFTGGEYMHIRNAIVILRAIHIQFPVINWMGQAQVATITELSRTEKREDLKIAATSLLGNLRRREKDWVLPQAFSLNKAAVNGGHGTRSTSAKPTTPQPENEGSKSLNALAPEFKPSGSSTHDGLLKPTPSASGRLEAEDGEIDDVTMASLTAKIAPDTSDKEIVEPEQLASEEIIMSLSEPEAPDQTAQPTLLNGITNAGDFHVDTEQKLESETVTHIPQSQGIPPKPASSFVPSQASVPTRPERPESNRNFSDSTFLNRQGHTLPSRPEVLAGASRPGEQRYDERLGDRHMREHREPRHSDFNRNDRPYDNSRERVSDRQASGSYPRVHDRPSERVAYEERERLDPNWGGEKSLPSRPPNNDRHHGVPGREIRSSIRDDRSERGPKDRQHSEAFDSARNSDNQGRSSRDISMAPPRSGVPQHPDRVGTTHGGQDSDRGYSGTHVDRRLEATRHDTHSNSQSQRSSRTSSPTRRDDHRSSRHDQRMHEDRRDPDSRRNPEDIPSLHSSRYEDTHPPTGPRTDRPIEGPSQPQNERFRESMRASPANTLSLDSGHGRLNSTSNNNTRQQDLQYGRLNADVPSGPRMSNGTHVPSVRNNTRSVSLQNQPSSNNGPNASQGSLPSSNVNDWQAPIGPASNRAPLRTSAPFIRPPPASTSAPSTPLAESPDVAGVHPDRLKAIQDTNPTDLPHTIHASSNTSPSATSSFPPAGPRAPYNNQDTSPVVPSRLSQAAPTGPSFPSSDRNRGDKRFAGLQNVLQQASGPNGGSDRSFQGTSIRGRGSRMNNFPNSVSSPTTSGPPTPLVPRQDQPSSRQDTFPPARADLFANRASSGAGTPQHHEEDPAHSRAPWRDAEHHSSRHHSSRSHSRDRHGGSNLPPQPTSRENDRPSRHGEEQRDHRARASMDGGPPPDFPSRDSRRGGREDMGGRDRDRRAESDRRDGVEWGAANGSGGERHDERERREGMGRKRGRGMDENGGGGFVEKRSRRGM
ncbi:THO complex subunit 2 [Xylographa parallela]|nr:THO complex subunit 2 [Xylographa parallela]